MVDHRHENTNHVAFAVSRLARHRRKWYMNIPPNLSCAYESENLYQETVSPQQIENLLEDMGQAILRGNLRLMIVLWPRHLDKTQRQRSHEVLTKTYLWLLSPRVWFIELLITVCSLLIATLRRREDCAAARGFYDSTKTPCQVTADIVTWN
jgi:hypothetical protein